MKTLPFIALVLASLSAVSEVISVLYDTTTKKIVAPTNVLGMTFGGNALTQLVGYGLTNDAGTLKVDTNTVGSGGGGGGGSGTVTSVGASTTVSGLGFSGSPVTTSGTISLTGTVAVASGGTGATDASGARTALSLVPGTDVQAYDSDLAAIAALANSGIIVRTGSGTVAARTITGDTEAVVSNGDGVSGNPTISIGSAIARDAEMAALYQTLNSTLTRLAGIGAGTLGDLIGRDGVGWTNIPAGSVGQALFQKSGGGFAWSNIVSSSTSYAPTTSSWSGLSIVTDVSKGRHFRITLTNATPATLLAPTNASDGDVVRWEFLQDATGSREIVLGSGLQGGSHITGIYLSTNANYVDYASAIYRQASNVWNVISNPGGYP